MWRTVFRCTFKLKHHTPVAHYYGGSVNGMADSLHGKHLLVDAIGALYNTCRRALASPEDSIERATARSALARRARGWGCSVAPTTWLGSAEHLATAVEMEELMEAKGARPEVFDFFYSVYGMDDGSGQGSQTRVRHDWQHSPAGESGITVLRESKIIPGLRMWMIVAMVGLVCSDQLS